MLKDDLMNKVASQLNLDSAIVSKVINSAFEEVTKAVKIHNEVEISGFGTLKISPTKMLKRLPGYKYMADFYENEYMTNPNPDNFRKMNDTKQNLETVKYRYEQIKGVPPVILERGKKL